MSASASSALKKADSSDGSDGRCASAGDGVASRRIVDAGDGGAGVYCRTESSLSRLPSSAAASPSAAFIAAKGDARPFHAPGEPRLGTLLPLRRGEREPRERICSARRAS